MPNISHSSSGISCGAHQFPLHWTLFSALSGFLLHFELLPLNTRLLGIRSNSLLHVSFPQRKYRFTSLVCFTAEAHLQAGSQHRDVARPGREPAGRRESSPRTRDQAAPTRGEGISCRRQRLCMIPFFSWLRDRHGMLLQHPREQEGSR